MKIVKASRGTIEQFSTALENKIAEIQQEVESSDEVMADTIPEDDPARVRYLHDLVGFVQNEMGREGLPTNQTIFDITDNALIITMGGDNVVEFEVPFADLSFDFDRIHEDTEYIVNAMI